MNHDGDHSEGQHAGGKEILEHLDVGDEVVGRLEEPFDAGEIHADHEAVQDGGKEHVFGRGKEPFDPPSGAAAHAKPHPQTGKEAGEPSDGAKIAAEPPAAQEGRA